MQYANAALTGPLPNTVSKGPVTAIATGNTAVKAVVGPCRGGYITNPSSDAAQGVTAESLFLDPVSAPTTSEAAANGSTTELSPGDTYIVPALKIGESIWVNGATTGHKFTCIVYT